jgi:uncharacterized protein (TIGR03083 family)
MPPPPVDDLMRALRLSYDQLAKIAARLDGPALTAGSYCRDWNRAQVLSHLGSGAEISLNALRAGLDGAPEPSREEIWARWNALPPGAMARGFVESDDRYLAAVERLDPEVRDTVQVPFFLGRTPLAGVLTFRLHEHTLHNWDIRVSLDPHATLLPEAVPLLLDLPPVIAQWAARPAGVDLPGPVRMIIRTADPERHYLLVVAGEQAKLTDADPGIPVGDTAGGDVTGHLDLPAEAFLRLAAGRLDPGHTPPGTEARGRPTLDELRALFPGY